MQAYGLIMHHQGVYINFNLHYTNGYVCMDITNVCKIDDNIALWQQNLKIRIKNYLGISCK